MSTIQDKYDQSPDGGITFPFRSSTIKGADLLLLSRDGDSEIAPVSSILEETANLYDFTAAQSGFMSTTGAVTASALFVHSGMIPVVAGQTYSIWRKKKTDRGARFITAFDAAGVVVVDAGVNSAGQAATTYLVPEGVASIRVTLDSTYFKTFMVEESPTPTTYKPYGYSWKVGALKNPAEFVDTPDISKLRIMVYGDSLAINTDMLPPLAETLPVGATITQNGIGGTKISGDNVGDAIGSSARINAITGTHDAIFIMGGTNDWAQSVAIGTPADSDPEATFCGGLNNLFLNIYTKFPIAEICILTPPHQEFYDFAARGWSNATENLISKTIQDYADAIKLVASRWGCRVVDVNGESGINRFNIAQNMKDDGAYLHPNGPGCQKIGNMIYKTIVNRLNTDIIAFRI
jgi:lysophospholipase L1-like esterase